MANHLLEGENQGDALLQTAQNRRKCGLPAETDRFLYERAILPMVLYGAIVWGKAIECKRNLAQLQRVQRLMALGITGTARTTSTDSLEVLAGLMPIQFRIQERAVCQLYNTMSDPDVNQRIRVAQVLEEHDAATTHTSGIQWARTCWEHCGLK